MVKTGNAVLTGLMVLVLSAGAAMAQQDHAGMMDQPQSKTPSEDMMKGCQKHGPEMLAAMNRLEKTIAAGRESNKPAKMKAALVEAQKQLAEAKHQMSMCPMMSSNMQQDEMGNMDHMKVMSKSEQN
jgi:hypothetical protein